MYNLMISDVLKFASALVSNRLFEQKSIDKSWAIASVLTLIGFVAYHLLVRQWVMSLDVSTLPAKRALDDICKFAVMFLVSKVLSDLYDGKKVNIDENMVNDASLFLVSLGVYNLVISPYVHNHIVNMNMHSRIAIDDVLKFGSALSVYHLVKGGSMSKEWIMSSVGYLVGIAVYDLFLE